MNSNTNKRSSFDARNLHQLKRTKQQESHLPKTRNTRFGDGVAWFRGDMIGKGNFGCVFIANLKNSKPRNGLYPRVMAVKSAEVSVSGSIQKEKEVLDNIRGCPNVIKCFGEEITDGENGLMVYNLLLEYGSGGTLADRIRSVDNGLREIEVKRYARSILIGLSHVHKRGYVHCDLKPENVLLVSDCRNVGFIAKIGDLGLAKRVGKNNNNNNNNNNNEYGYWRGTPLYLSPEAVIQGVQEPPADIWAVGCIVFHMLTGKQLWLESQDLGVDEVLSRICDVNDLPFVNCGLSNDAVSFLKGCLSRKVMFRLTAKMLLNHPFLEGLDEDNVNVNEIEVFDINAITSSSSFSDDDDDDSGGGLWVSSCSEESRYNLSSWSE
ncbi:mitogen-activated protein kinase kinase kinase 20-like [Bidens hawaiensis]|uniref:mitogen-activated protein kinase kinase kinase 20-like n=1 Tax=Bidens hawaiensis TaxID=980011 RepID=UPI00404A7B5D